MNFLTIIDCFSDLILVRNIEAARCGFKYRSHSSPFRPEMVRSAPFRFESLIVLVVFCSSLEYTNCINVERIRIHLNTQNNYYSQYCLTSTISKQPAEDV